jgi:tRNA(adenine34) deaminase
LSPPGAYVSVRRMQAGLQAFHGVADADRRFMAVALREAEGSAAAGEVPVGAVVVRDTEILGLAHNAPLVLCDPTAHAEVLALRAAARREGNYRLPGATMYVTVEPCVMCVGALLQARVARVVFGCRAPKGGALGTLYDLGRDERGNHQFEVTGVVGEAEAARLLQTFFRMRRGA